MGRNTLKPTQRGFAPIIILIAIVLLASSSIILFKGKDLNLFSTPKIQESSPSAQIETSHTSSDSGTPSAKPSSTEQMTSVSQTAASPRSITVSGFAYEDRSNDGLFNSDDPKLRDMQFYIYDSFDNRWVNTIYSEGDGLFTVTMNVKGDLILKPTCSNNFCPKDVSKKFSSSATGQQFAFRSGGAPTGENNGQIEGDIIAGSRQYKFYILDKEGNYFTNIEYSGNHFKVQNLPNNKTYIIRVSYGDDSPDNTEVSLTPSAPQKSGLQIITK
jgi:hypothetical protein